LADNHLILKKVRHREQGFPRLWRQTGYTRAFDSRRDRRCPDGPIRVDSGTFAYWRTFPGELALFVTGEIDRSWTTSPQTLSGQRIVKIPPKIG
jgi:hypothetical protein